jgi:predicted O-methyltransferase YrrM
MTLSTKLKARLRSLRWQIAEWVSGFLAGSLPSVAGSLARFEVINRVIDSIGAKTYLEIGVNTPKQPGYSRDKIKAQVVHGVDPNPNSAADYIMTSDLFFSSHCSISYDVVFIDGMHLFEQAYKDVLNGLENLREGGVVIVHDTRPDSRITQTRNHGQANKWHGDVWKAILFLRLTHRALNVITVDTDEGCTIISKGVGNPPDVNTSENIFCWRFYSRNYKEVLNLVSVDEFMREFPIR